MGLRDLFNGYDKKKRRSHFKNLFAVARADGDLRREEMDLVIGLAENFNMSTDEVTRIIRNCKSLGVKLGCEETRIDSLVRDLIDLALGGNAPENAVEKILGKYS
jgi:hypothetical protein